MTQRESGPRRFGELAPSSYPGERLGLAQSGPRSVGRVGRRLLGVFIDWAIAWLLVVLVPGLEQSLRSLVVLAIFAVLQIVFIPLLAGSPGHLILGMRVVRMGGGWVGVWRPIVRTVLLVLVIPAVIWDADQRGLHDKAAGTVLIRA